MSSSSAFASAAWAFAQLVRDIPESAWDGPGLGDWDLRALVGHTSRSLLTVSTYLTAPCDHRDIDSPAAYYAMVRQTLSTSEDADIVERGRQAGRDLGADPASKVEQLVEQALTDVAAISDQDTVIAVFGGLGGLGIRLHDYLPTRTFELAVHGLDIGRATGIAVEIPADVLDAATTLAAQIAVQFGDGPAVLLALTGRQALPPSFSVV